MTEQEIFEIVKQCAVEQLALDDEGKVTLDATFIEDLEADSLDVVELIMALEERFELEISDEDAEKMKTVEDVVKYIAKNK